MKTRPFIQCDVFSDVATKGNALAVVLEADGLSNVEMQAFAAWTNLAETTFVMRPTDGDADYKLRIFTPGREMLFAGHPTLGSCMAWLALGGAPAQAGRVVQECGVGLVEIDVSGATPAFAAPATKVSPMAPEMRAKIIGALGLNDADVLNALELENGPVWQLLEVASAEAALAVDEARVLWPEFVGVSVIGVGQDTDNFDYEVRNISPSSGMSEDPITGSLNAAIAHWLHGAGRLTGPLVMRQGTKIGRKGRVDIRVDETGRLMIGGAVNILIKGDITL